MKSEKGVTLITLTIFIIVLTIVIAVIATVTGFFTSNVRKSISKASLLTEYTRFNSYFSNEVNKDNIKVIEYSENYIVFDDGTQYTYIPENRGIYRNKAKIAKGIDNCKFDVSSVNGKEVVDVKIGIGNKNRQTLYTLNQ